MQSTYPPLIDTEALLDSGAQVSVLSRSFLAEQFPDIKVKNVKELLGDQNLELLAVNNLSVPYEGFVEITLTLVGKKDNFSIRVPFLVTPAKIDQTLIGFNVICELIRANSSENTRALLSRQTESVRDHKFHSGMLIHRWFTDRGHFISHLRHTQE